MSKYLLALFLVLSGLTGLLNTAIPAWVLHVVAIAAGAGLLVEQTKK